MNAPAGKVTASLKFTVRLLAISTSIAPFAGTLAATVGAVSTLKVRTTLAAGFCGGSMVSLSPICAATAVAVQLAPAASGLVGVKVSVGVPLPVMAPATAPPQLSVIAAPRLDTFSSKVKLTV